MALVLFAAFPGIVVAQIGDPRVYASTRVFKISTDKSRGSTVLARLDSRDGLVLAYFITCYHVLQGSSSFTIYSWKGTRIASHEDRAQVYRRWNQEFVVIRVEVRDAAGLESVPLKDHVGRDGPNSLRSSPTGFAIGYPGYDDRKPQYLDIRMDGERAGDDPALGILDPQADRPSTGDDTDLTAMRLRYLTKEPTHPGMSGGLVVDSSGRVGGLILGRVKNEACLMIPAYILADAVELVAARPERLMPYRPGLFTSRSPFRREVEQHLFSETNYAADAKADALDRILRSLTPTQRERLAGALEASVDRISRAASLGSTSSAEALDEARLRGDLTKLQEELGRLADDKRRKSDAANREALVLDREIASVAILRGDYPECRKRLGEIVAHEPSNWDAINELGIVEFRSGQVKEAESYFRRIIEKSDPQSLWQAKGLANLAGLVQALRLELDDSELNLRKALLIASKGGFREVEGVIHGNLSMIHAIRGDFAGVEREIAITSRIFTDLRKLDRVAETNAVMANRLNTMGRYELAREYAKKAIELSESRGYAHIRAAAYEVLGDIEFNDDRMLESEIALHKALDLAMKYGFRREEYGAYVTLSQIKIRERALQPAISLLDRAMPIATSLSAMEAVAKVHRLKGDIARLQGDREKALQLYRQSRDMLVKHGLAKKAEDLDAYIQQEERNGVGRSPATSPD